MQIQEELALLNDGANSVGGQTAPGEASREQSQPPAPPQLQQGLYMPFFRVYLN